MKRILLTVAATVILASSIASCAGQQGIPNAGPGTGISTIHVQGEPVTCFTAINNGTPQSINCLPDWFINYNAAPQK